MLSELMSRAAGGLSTFLVFLLLSSVRSSTGSSLCSAAGAESSGTASGLFVGCLWVAVLAGFCGQRVREASVQAGSIAFKGLTCSARSRYPSNVLPAQPLSAQPAHLAPPWLSHRARGSERSRSSPSPALARLFPPRCIWDLGQQPPSSLSSESLGGQSYGGVSIKVSLACNGAVDLSG